MLNLPKSVTENFGKLSFSLIGLATVCGHYVVYSQNQREIKETVRTITREQIDPVKESINESRMVREKEFVRRPDLEKIIARIDLLNEQIGIMREQVAKLEGFLKGRERQRNDAFWGK